MRSPRRHSPRRHAPSWRDAARAAVVLVVAVGGYQVAAADGVPSASTDWFPDIPIPTIGVPNIDHDELTLPGVEDDKLWMWRGASTGAVRTVTIDIDPSIYPTDGVEWFVNGQHDRHDVHGPLDKELGLWHSQTQSFDVGDVITACWQSADGNEHCPSIRIR